MNERGAGSLDSPRDFGLLSTVFPDSCEGTGQEKEDANGQRVIEASPGA